jgi:hypothetical protein
LPSWIGNVYDLEFDAIAPTPGITAQVSGNVQRHSACRQERITERLPRSTEGDGIDPGAVAAFKQRADVRASDDLAKSDAMRGQHEPRFGIALPERADAVEQFH